MSTRLLLAPVLCIVLRCTSSAAVSSQLSSDASLVRRESSRASQRTSALQLDHAGKATVLRFDEDLDEDEKDYCNVDFPLGKENDNHCKESNHSRIYDNAECMQAAAQAGAWIVKDKFAIGFEWYALHPKGCFMHNCIESPNGVCYWYNGVDQEPANVTGTPVCKRPKLANGTANSNGNNQDCPGSYQAITDSETCAMFGECLGYCHPGLGFRIGRKNNTEYHLYPKYCFVNENDGCVYFNEPGPLGAAEGNPKQPVGMPICNVSSITHFDAGTADAPKATAEAKTETKKEEKTGEGEKTKVKKELAAAGPGAAAPPAEKKKKKKVAPAAAGPGEGEKTKVKKEPAAATAT